MAARKPSARIVLNFAALGIVEKAIAKGMTSLAHAIGLDASQNVEVSEDPRYGHIRDNWGLNTYVDGRKVDGASADGTAARKPRDFRPGKGMSSVVGFGFPARLHETGTSDTAAEPFLAPAVARQASNATELIRAGAAPYWPRKG